MATKQKKTAKKTARRTDADGNVYFSKAKGPAPRRTTVRGTLGEKLKQVPAKPLKRVRPPEFRAFLDDDDDRLDDDEIVVDNFAGGGGASSGVERAIGRSPDIAINHDAEAIAMHMANHPSTVHYRENIWQVDPVAACQGRPVGLVWCSPDCKHFSKAKGTTPRSQKIRGLAWTAVRWAAKVRPRVICMENVEEFATWGPLYRRHNDGCKPTKKRNKKTGEVTMECSKASCTYGLPIKERRAETFNAFVRKLTKLGYKVEWKLLRACDFGAPTSRRRFFLIARCDGRPINWPQPTHGPEGSGLLPYRTAAECIDWSIEVPSIFDRDKPHAEKTLARIARGIRKFVLTAARPFLVPTAHGDKGGVPRVHSADEPMRTICGNRGDSAVVVPYLVHRSNGERPTKIDDDGTVHAGQAPRIYDIKQPLGTVMAQGQKHALVSALLIKHNGGNNDKAGSAGQTLDRPCDTITARDAKSLATATLAKLTDEELVKRARKVAAFLVRYNGKGEPETLEKPLGTLTTRDRYGLVTVEIEGETYAIVDIGMRMLAAPELFACQGFPSWSTMVTGEAWRAQTTHEEVDLRSRADLDSALPAAPSSSHASSESTSNKRADVRVRIDLGRNVLELHSLARSASHVSSAELLGSFPLPTDIAASAQQLAPGASCADQTPPHTRAATFPSSSRSTSPSTGESPVGSSGSVTTARASGAAGGFVVSLDRRATQFTISPDGQSFLISDSIATTLCSYAARAIASSILGRTSSASSFDLEIEVTHRYDITAESVLGEPLTKTAQVKMCGNSVPPPMSEAIVRAQFKPVSDEKPTQPRPARAPLAQPALPGFTTVVPPRAFQISRGGAA